MNNTQKDIFEDYLRNEEKDAEGERKFADLFSDKKNEPWLRQWMWRDWSETYELTDVDLSPILHKLHFLINSESASNNKNRRSLNKVWKWYSRVAAILILPLLTAVGIYFLLDQQPKPEQTEPSMVEVVAPMGSRIKTKLPDGTEGWLNSGSVMKYEVPFESRHVEIQGEAYFDVKTDSARPFVVEGKHGCVRVMGTRFNVKMWPDEDLTEVVLEEGEVELRPHSSKQRFGMNPGEMLVLDASKNKLTRSHVNPRRYSAWTEGKLIFRGDSMESVARELSRWFNAEVDIKDEELKDYVFRATFENEQLDEVMRLLKMTSPIDYKIIDHKQDSEGTFSRKKVIIRSE
ncbi:MAG: FecR family protein [Bacteroidota bacterium]